MSTSSCSRLLFLKLYLRTCLLIDIIHLFFFPARYALGEIGSGSHVHISLSQNGKNVFMASDECSRYGMSKIGEEFMSGVLNHLPSILAFTAPVPNR